MCGRQRFLDLSIQRYIILIYIECKFPLRSQIKMSKIDPPYYTFIKTILPLLGNLCEVVPSDDLKVQVLLCQIDHLNNRYTNSEKKIFNKKG